MGELKNLKVFLIMFWQYRKNNKRLEKFFRLREFQMPEWGKKLFLKWVCENGLLWYLFQQVNAIIEHSIYWAENAEYLHNSHIERLRKQVAELEKQGTGKAIPPASMEYQSPARCGANYD